MHSLTALFCVQNICELVKQISRFVFKLYFHLSLFLHMLHAHRDSETLIHLIKGSFGSGILAMPLAFANAGSWFGLVATIAVGIICTCCVHILVKCSHILYRRAQVPSLTYPGVAETAFLTGPQPLQKWSRTARFVIEAFLVIIMFGALCVYDTFVASNVKQVIEQYFESSAGLDLRWYLLMLLPLLLPINMIRNLKYLAPFSAVANLLMTAGIFISIYYTFVSEQTNDFEPPPINERPTMAELQKLPLFFGTVIFALEGIGVVSNRIDQHGMTHFNFRCRNHFLLVYDFLTISLQNSI